MAPGSPPRASSTSRFSRAFPSMPPAASPFSEGRSPKYFIILRLGDGMNPFGADGLLRHMTPFSRIDEAPGRGRLRRMIAALVLSLVASFGLIWAPLSGAASDVPPGGEVGPWTLARVLDAARAASPAALAASAHGRAGEADGAAAWSALLPHVAFRAGLTRSDDPALLFAQRLQQGTFTSQDFAIESLNQPGPRNALEEMKRYYGVDRE